MRIFTPRPFGRRTEMGRGLKLDRALTSVDYCVPISGPALGMCTVAMVESRGEDGCELLNTTCKTCGL